MWRLSWFNAENNFNDVAVFHKGYDYRIHFWCASKNEAVTLLINADLCEYYKVENCKSKMDKKL